MGIIGPTSTVERYELPAQVLRSVCSTFYVIPTDVLNIIRGLGSWVTEIFDGLDYSQCHEFARGVANVALSLVLYISKVVSERTTDNIRSIYALPAVVPHHLAKLLPVNFQVIVRRNMTRLEATFSLSDVDAIE